MKLTQLEQDLQRARAQVPTLPLLLIVSDLAFICAHSISLDILYQAKKFEIWLLRIAELIKPSVIHVLC